jgi:hypothetical protein
LTAARIAGIGLKSGFVIELPILVRIAWWSRAEGVTIIFTIILDLENLTKGPKIIKWGYDMELGGKGHSLQLYYFY